MGFSDKLQVNDGITIALSCGLCGQPASMGHVCSVRRMLRDPAVVKVTRLVEPDSTNPLDDFLVQSDDGSEEYVTTRANIDCNYHEL